MHHPLIRTPTQRLRDARDSHGRCLRLAAAYRISFARGDRSMLTRHVWALEQARRLRLRFPGLLSHPAG